MTDEQYDAWRLKSRAEREAVIVERLMEGKLILGHVDYKYDGPADFPMNTLSEYISRWKEQGFITGFVPRFSGAGIEYFRGLHNIQNALPREPIPELVAAPGKCPYCGKPEPHEKKVKCIVTETIETVVKGEVQVPPPT
jgi:hypothetical protein